MTESETVYEVNLDRSGLLVVDKFASAIEYIYPVLVNISNKHRVIRDEAVLTLFKQQQLFYDAAKSDQISKLYLADSGLAYMRELLRFLVNKNLKLISVKQYEVSMIRIAETGKILGTWIKTKSRNKNR
jgi:hypothetical protein